MLEKEEQWQEALHAFQKIESLDAENSLIKTHLGMVRHLLGQDDAARKHLEKALLASENNLWAFLLRVQLENVPNKKRWLGNDRQEVEPILDELLYLSLIHI